MIYEIGDKYTVTTWDGFERTGTIVEIGEDYFKVRFDDESEMTIQNPNKVFGI